LRSFIGWLESEKFYGKVEITWVKGRAVIFEKKQTFKAEDFEINRPGT